jgi:hypothetical protein
LVWFGLVWFGLVWFGYLEERDRWLHTSRPTKQQFMVAFLSPS